MLWNCETVAHKREEWVARRVREACHCGPRQRESQPAIARHVRNPSILRSRGWRIGSSGPTRAISGRVSAELNRVGSSQQKIRKGQMLD